MCKCEQGTDYALPSNDKLCQWEGGSPRLDGRDHKGSSETNGFSSTECEARKQDVTYMIPAHPAGRFATIYRICSGIYHFIYVPLRIYNNKYIHL